MKNRLQTWVDGGSERGYLAFRELTTEQEVASFRQLKLELKTRSLRNFSEEQLINLSLPEALKVIPLKKNLHVPI